MFVLLGFAGILLGILSLVCGVPSSVGWLVLLGIFFVCFGPILILLGLLRGIKKK